MTLSIPTELEEFVAERVASGEYPSPEAVVSAGIQLLKERDKQRDALRQDIDAAIQQIENGDYFEYDEASLDEFFAELQAKLNQPKQTIHNTSVGQ